MFVDIFHKNAVLLLFGGIKRTVGFGGEATTNHELKKCHISFLFYSTFYRHKKLQKVQILQFCILQHIFNVI